MGRPQRHACCGMAISHLRHGCSPQMLEPTIPKLIAAAKEERAERRARLAAIQDPTQALDGSVLYLQARSCRPSGGAKILCPVI